ncbi:isopentenyl-diphosphate Delta-isomerase [Parasediminibacterium paludis]|uniref:Isopentenyl-diphosphate delta-isomerase n=1 Tax=Parasediminibacterium paludis TaxID=908966 RepID=A0ABV8PY64_9BACT
METVVLVNESDVEIGLMEKMEAHEKAMLHRAFSVFIFNRKGELLLQQRALRKYHSGGLWTNTCCSHPRPHEDIKAAAHRRLREEMGFDTELVKAFDFTYKAEFTNGLTEHEFDHVFIGTYDDLVQPNFDEVENYAYRALPLIEAALKNNPDFFTEWFHIAFPKVVSWLAENKS